MNEDLHFEPIPQYPNYGISRCGQVKNFKTDSLVVAFLENGYYRTNVYKEGDKKNYREPIHRLLAMAYLGYEPTNRKIVVDHINNIRDDNRLENLQIITQRLNSSKDRVRDLPTGVYKNGKKYSSKICETIDGVRWNHYLGIFPTIEEAARAYQKAAKMIDINTMSEYL